MEDSIDELLNEREENRVEYEAKLTGLHNDLKEAKKQTQIIQIRFAEYLLNNQTSLNEIIALTTLDEATILMLSKK